MKADRFTIAGSFRKNRREQSDQIPIYRRWNRQDEGEDGEIAGERKPGTDGWRQTVCL